MGREGGFGGAPDRQPEWAMTIKGKMKQRVAIAFAIGAALAWAPAAVAQDRAAIDSSTGFYGGVSVRDRGSESAGVSLGGIASSWSRFATPPIDESASRAIMFGGYRWRNDITVEALISSADKYSLRPGDSSILARPGVGLGVGNSNLGFSDTQARNWNVDVYTSWAFYKSFALYGRLGYGSADSAATFAGTGGMSGIDTRRIRDSVNYGVGLRYDLSSDLGLRLEYARFGRIGLDLSSNLPESDHVTFGVQFRF
jgi:hypothetical protein